MPLYKKSRFQKIARSTARAAGHPASFVIALTATAVWALTGPVTGYSDTWQLTINTATTILTFLMVFLIQNSQNHSEAVLQIKLDELIRSNGTAHNALLDLEELAEEELHDILRRYQVLAAAAREQLRRRETDLGTPDVKVP